MFFFHFFAVWARGGRGRGWHDFFLLFGRGCVYFFLFFAVWAGDGSSLTYRSAWLVFKRPNNKKDQTTKKNTGSVHSLLLRGTINPTP